MRSEGVLVEAREVTKVFPGRRGLLGQHVDDVRAVDGVSLAIHRGETLALVGESGSGKSTLGRLILRLVEPTSGSLSFDGIDLLTLPRERLRRTRRRMQIIFQDPYSSLNPAMTVRAIVREPLAIHRVGTRAEQEERTLELLRLVGLEPELARRHPHELSGGERQRVGIARALALEPDFLVADEPVTALDVSVQAQILNLLLELQERLSLTYLFIAHDLRVVEHVSDRIAVMDRGRIVETQSRAGLFCSPRHARSRELLASVP
jgi:ABC-type glutathione transport system ATPase component